MVEIRAVNAPFRVGLTALLAADNLPANYETVRWNFGRGGRAFGVRPSVTFSEPGPVTVRVEVVGSLSGRLTVLETATRTFEVAPAVEVPQPTPEPPKPPEPEPEPEPSLPSNVIGAKEFAEGPAEGEFSQSPLQTFGLGPSSFQLQAIRDQNGDRLVQPGDVPTAVIDQVNQNLQTGVKRFLEPSERIPESVKPGTTVTRTFQSNRFEVEITVSGVRGGPPTGPGTGPPTPRPGSGPLLQIPKPTLESRTFVILGQEVTIPTTITFTEETFQVRLPSFQSYLATANLPFDLTKVGFRLDQLTNSLDGLELDVQELRRRVQSLPGAGVIRDIRQAVQDVRREVVGSVRELRGLIRARVQEVRSVVQQVDQRLTRLTNNLQAAVSRVRSDLRRELSQARRDLAQGITQAVRGLRTDLIPEALSPQAFVRTARREVLAVLPVQPGVIGETVQDVQDLVTDPAIRGFRQNPAGYVLNAVLSEARRRDGPALARRLRRLVNALLEAVIDSDTQQRLKDQAE